MMAWAFLVFVLVVLIPVGVPLALSGGDWRLAIETAAAMWIIEIGVAALCITFVSLCGGACG